MKKYLSLIVFTVLFALGITACSSQQGAGTDATAGDNKPIEITFWHSMDGVFAETLQKQVDGFNEGIGKEQGIHVTPVFQDWPGTSSLTLAMTSDDVKNMPDVIQLYAENVSLIRDYDRTVWAEDMFAKNSELLKKEDLLPTAATSYSIDGKMIGVPYNISSLLMYYNEDLLKQAGISEAPKTLSELAAAMTAIKGKTSAKQAVNVEVTRYELENWIVAQGTDGAYFGNNESGHTGALTEFAAADNGALKDYLDAWQQVVDTDALKPVDESMKEEFANQDSAIAIMSSSRIPEMKESIGDTFKWNVAPIPTVHDADKPGAFPSGAGLYMLNRDDEARVNAAWLFTQYMASAPAQELWLESTGYVPVNTKVLEGDAYKKAVSATPQISVAFDTLKNSGKNVLSAFVPAYDEVDSVIDEAMKQFGAGETNADETYNTISKGVQDAFDEYYKLNPAG